MIEFERKPKVERTEEEAVQPGDSIGAGVITAAVGWLIVYLLTGATLLASQYATVVLGLVVSLTMKEYDEDSSKDES